MSKKQQIYKQYTYVVSFEKLPKVVETIRKLFQRDSVPEDEMYNYGHKDMKWFVEDMNRHGWYSEQPDYVNLRFWCSRNFEPIVRKKFEKENLFEAV